MGLETPPPPEGRPATDVGEPTPDESRAAFTPSQLLSQTPAGTTPDLPEFGKKADDLEAIKKAVDDAASVSGALWFSYLFFLFYLAVAAGAVTHADLFLENPVKLPFLGVELPLVAFFFLAPILFLVVHAYVLVHLVMLTDKAKRFHEKLHEQINDKDIRDGLRRQLPSNVFVQLLAGPPEARLGLFGFALRAIGWATLVVGPILLLLLLQLQFLPHHSSFVAWTQRLALAADLVLIWWLWGRILSGRDMDKPKSAWRRRGWSALGFALSLGAILFAGAVATFPGEWPQTLLPGARIFPKPAEASDQPTKTKELSFWDWMASYHDWIVASERVSLHDWVFDSPVDTATGRRRFPFSNTLVLIGFNIYEALKIDDPKKAEWRDFVFRARGRDLKGATFAFANLPRIDFTAARLQGASFEAAKLEGASFACPNRAKDRIAPETPPPDLCTQLQGASFLGAELKGVSLKGAQLQDASLEASDLREVSLDAANLERATFYGTQLQGASLRDANLRGAQLAFPQLEGANLQGAQLQGAWLDGALLQGAELSGAQLQGVYLYGAELQGATLDGAQLHGAILEGAQLQGASLEGAQLQGATLDRAQLQGATLQAATLDATDLSGAFLWRTNFADRNLPGPKAIRFADAPDWQPKWNDFGQPQPWDDKAYQNLHDTIEALPAGEQRDQAQKRILRLDCNSDDKTLASCNPDPSQAPPREAVDWRNVLETAARINKTDYEVALAAQLKAVVCSGGDNAIYVLRGVGFQDRLKAVGGAASDLISDLTNKDSKDCPVAAELTDDDKAALLQIKQEAKNAGK
jgi:uncharacterized protein YjbI with pentapeptide repeats